MSVFIFPANNLSKYQWIFTKLDICIDIVEIWFDIANGQISSIFDRYLVLSFQVFIIQCSLVFHLQFFFNNYLS